MAQNEELQILIEQTRSGCKQAYGELYEQTIGDVYKTVYFLLDDKIDIEDVIQEIYLQLYKSLRTYDVAKPFRPWLIGLSIKQVHAYRRKRWMGLRIIRKAETTAAEQPVDFSNDVINKVANEQLITQVNQLPFKLRQVVILHYLHDYSQEEVAAILQIPLGTVKSRIHASLKNLRRTEKNKRFFKERGEII
ncbi:MAG: sigma-70 family RNA polymerase sigma factor [Bacillus sp. (in: firmicutes)]